MGFVSLNVLLYVVQIHGLENLALHQPTWEQNPWPDKMRDFGSENAVDGYSYYIYTGRVAGFFVFVSNTTSKDDGYLCYHDKSTDQNMLTADQHINCTLQGRYVIYYNERKPGVNYPTFYSKYAYHELCELEVYGCNGTYGEDCVYPCPTNCQDRRCDINTGLCFSCVPGYKGPQCNFVCNNNTYGPECALKCGNCSNGQTCHHVNGTCFNGCAVEAIGDSCKGVRATNTQPCSWTESYNIVIVVMSVLIVVTGSLINFVIWKRNAAKFSRMSMGNMPQPTSKREEKDYQYTELEEVDKSKTYEEIHSYSN
uniref:Scavenger receptor class F member 2 n=1 Tax=Magallana gigas TaxID=29159 RepID=A0A8W8MHY4_MAGGI